MYKKLFFVVAAVVSMNGASLFAADEDGQGKGCGCPKPKVVFAADTTEEETKNG